MGPENSKALMGKGPNRIVGVVNPPRPTAYSYTHNRPEAWTASERT